jgi:hypothetical protein
MTINGTITASMVLLVLLLVSGVVRVVRAASARRLERRRDLLVPADGVPRHRDRLRRRHASPT